MLKGIDVSKWQGQIDWDLVKDQIDFAVIRASYGTGFKDEYFDKNRSSVRDIGLPRGYYHYAYPNHNTPEAEADWFTSVLGKLNEGEILFLDFEENYPDPVGWSKRFLDRLSANYGGYKPLIYINKYMTQTYDWRPVANNNYGLWLAYWDYDPDSVGHSADAWDTIAFRQYSNQENFDGIAGRVDANVFYGDFDQLNAYGFPDEQDPDTTPPTTIAELEAKIEELEVELKEMRASRNYWRTYAKDLEEKTSKEIETLKTQLKICQSQNEILVTNNTTLKKDKDVLESLVEAQKGEIETLTKENEELKEYKQKYEDLVQENREKLCDFPYWQRVLSLLRCK